MLKHSPFLLVVSGGQIRAGKYPPASEITNLIPLLTEEPALQQELLSGRGGPEGSGFYLLHLNQHIFWKQDIQADALKSEYFTGAPDANLARDLCLAGRDEL